MLSESLQLGLLDSCLMKVKKNPSRPTFFRNGSPFLQNRVLFTKKMNGNLGDIMSDTREEDFPSLLESTVIWTDGDRDGLQDGLVTSTGKSLQDIFSDHAVNISGLDRIALTANGNLQRSKFFFFYIHK
jgi:hypothetical protein